MWGIAAAAFVAIFAFDTPFPAIVLAAGLIGHFGARRAPQVFALGGGHGSAQQSYGAGADRRRHTDTGARTLLARSPGQGAGRRPGAVGCSRWRALVAAQGVGAHAHADGLVLHQGRAADLRRRLRGAALRLPGRGRAAAMAQRRADDRRAGAGRDHAGPADHGGGLRRLRRRLAEAGAGAGRAVRRRRARGDAWSPSSPSCRRSCSSWPAARWWRPRTASWASPRRCRRSPRGGRRDPEPRAVLRLPRAVAAGLRRPLRRAVRA